MLDLNEERRIKDVSWFWSVRYQYDMLWYDMIMISDDMICYDTTWLWYNMRWYGMILYDVIWCVMI